MADISSNPSPCLQEEPNHFFRELDIQLLIHELKGPLSVIENNDRMLLEHQRKFGSLNEAQQRAIGRSIRCSAKLREIIHTVLEVGRSEIGRLCPIRFDVVETIKTIIADVLETEFFEHIDELPADTDEVARQAEYIKNNGVVLNISPEVKGMRLHQDQVKFAHIMNNLVRNALQHRKSRVDIHVAINGSHLRIRVNDDGDGIAPEDQIDLFQCYTQTKSCSRKARAMGHGLGLAGSRILARRIGGDITIDTQFKMGSSFLLQLPITLNL